MPKIPIVKAKDFLKYLLRYGCELVSVKGSHHKILNKSNKQISILPIHSNKDLAPALFFGGYLIYSKKS